MPSHTLSTPIGSIEIRLVSNYLQSIEFHSNKARVGEDSKLLNTIKMQLEAYFEDPQIDFDIPLSMSGTSFQQRVWSALREIPPGQTRSYGDLAKTINSSPRAVGNACRRNPIPIIVPCHRVVSASGIGGFAGATEGEHIRIKRWLLAHEGVEL
jgi:methylated-DNA-[protein]-cysteine S-methyltransferase